MQRDNTFLWLKNGDTSKGDLMDRIIYALKLGLIIVLVFSTVSFFWPTQNSLLSKIIFCLLITFLFVLVTLFLVGKPNKK